MSPAGRVRSTFVVTIIAAIATFGVVEAQNHAPNPYRVVEGWAQDPPGRPWGSTSAVFPARDGSGNIWVAERCGQNICTGKDDLAPILLFDPSGKILKSFGAGVFVWPHGIHVDRENNVWVTDARGAGNKGHQVHKFSADGELLMSLGVAGVAALGETTFNQPGDVLVAPNGDIFVADGHGAGGNNRIVKLSSDGTFIKAWGQTGGEDGSGRSGYVGLRSGPGHLQRSGSV